jgi:aspartokinase-like uncharacterized kinase
LNELAVVKVGGSLYDLPDLGARLLEWLAQFPSKQVLLVPGGGPTADAVRKLDRRHNLGEEVAHWLALQALALNAHFLAALVPEATVVESCEQRSKRISVLDPLAFCRADERDHPADALPHTWDVTSDSIAARVAVAGNARQLILLKSATIPAEMKWEDASRAGYVDRFFPAVIRAAPSLRIKAVSFRSRND